MESVDQLEATTLDRKDHRTSCIASSLAWSTNHQDPNLVNKPRAQTMGWPSLLLRTENKYNKTTNKIKYAYDTQLLHLHINVPKQNKNLPIQKMPQVRRWLPQPK